MQYVLRCRDLRREKDDESGEESLICLERESREVTIQHCLACARAESEVKPL